MAIFKKNKANKDRENASGARSPTNSPPVQAQPSMTAAIARDVSGSYAPANPNMNARRMTGQMQQLAQPDRSSMQTPTGRASPIQGGPPQIASNYPLGMGLPSTVGAPMASMGGAMNGPMGALGAPISGLANGTSPMAPLQQAQQPPGQQPLQLQSPQQLQQPAAASNPGYPWSTRRLRLYQPPTPGAAPMSPFPRYGLSVPPYPSHSGHMLLFGGLVRDRAHNDLWSLDVRDCSLQLVKTRGDAPAPRIGHVSAIADRIMLVFGGDTKVNETDHQDNGLYVLDLRTQEWTSVPCAEGPAGRYGHAACMLDSWFYVHGGHVDGQNLDDLWAFDIRQLSQDQSSAKYKWERISYSTPAPLARTGHTLVPFENKLYLFGGTDGDYHYNDSWSFDMATGAWSELECIGYIPIPREGHAAAIVDDVVYVFGGRDVHGKDLGDLAAFRISNQRWYMFQNMGPTPMPKSGHSLCAAHGKVFVIGGESNLAAQVTRDDPNLVHVLDTMKIKYPADNQGPRGAAPVSRPRTTSDATDRRPAPQNRPYPPTAGAAGAGTSQFSQSVDNLSRSMSPMVVAAEPRPLIIANDTGSSHSRHTPRSESQDSGPPRVNGQPPQRPKRADDEEYRRAMSPTTGGLNSNGTASSSPVTDSRIVTPNGRAASPPPHIVASHTVHPNARNTRSPPPQLRVGENGDSRPALPPDAFYFGGKSPTAGSRPTSMNLGGRPGSLLGRPGSGRPGSLLMAGGRPGSMAGRPGSIAGAADLVRELKARETEADNAKRREAALRVVLSQAVAQGFVVDDEKVELPPADLLGDNETLRQLAEAFVQMKQEKATLQNEVATQMRTASDRIQDSERLQKGALQEAAYYRAKVAALESGSSTDVSRIETERAIELERQLEETAKQYTANQRELERVKSDLERHTDLSTTASEREAETLKRAEEAEGAVAALQEELDQLRQQSSTNDRTIRDHTERFITLSSTHQQREAERDQYKEQLDDALNKHAEYLLIIEQAQASITSAGVRSTELENMHGRAKEQISSLQQQLSEVRLQLEAKEREVEQATERLAEVETMHNTTREEANSLRGVTSGRLGELLESTRAIRTDDDRQIKGHQDQLRALEEEKSSLLKLLREAGQRVDGAEAAASSHRGKAREIEVSHQQLRGEMRAHRTKLLSAQQEIAKFRELYSSKDAELHERDEAVTDLQTRVSLLRKLLADHGIAVSDTELESAETPTSSELETKLRDKSRAHENAQREVEELTRRCHEAEDKVESLGRLVERSRDARSPSAASMRSPSPGGSGDAGRRAIEAERKLQEAETVHKEKMAALESDYQTAVRYVKGTEKMLKRMKDELNKQKTTNSSLLSELDGMRGRSASVEPGARTREASGRITPSEPEVTRRLQTLQNQFQSLQAELQASQDVVAARNREVDILRMRCEENERDNEGLRDDLAQAQHRITTLLEMNQSGIHMGSDDEDERVALRRGSSASSDGGTSMAFDKFTKELKQWDPTTRSPDMDDSAVLSDHETAHSVHSIHSIHSQRSARSGSRTAAHPAPNGFGTSVTSLHANGVASPPPAGNGPMFPSTTFPSAVNSAGGVAKDAIAGHPVSHPSVAAVAADHSRSSSSYSADWMQ